ncbi:MAG: hypothetical protein KDC87_05000 [Planctomycetes bacterium]|nr:hypothetical protein [Planctomycetota bacterium]MCB9869749.1 hypothetical protein [Planctomycetota bacterium]
MRIQILARSFLCALAACLAQVSVRAQAADVGLVVSTTGARAGTLCATVNCAALPITVLRGGALTINVYGAINSPYLLALGTPTPSCTPIPGIANQMMLGPPILVFLAGTTLRPNAISVCLIGQDTLSLTVPANGAIGTLHLQGVVQSLRTASPAFTPTLAVTIQ